MAITDTIPGEKSVRLSLTEIRALAVAAVRGCGASAENADSLAQSIVAAEAEGLRAVGLAHLPDYCEGLLAGRVTGTARPMIERPAATVFRSDAGSGFAHPGFDLVFEDFIGVVQQLGMAVFTQRNAFTCGALGYFVSRLAGRGLVALAFSNAGPAAVVTGDGVRPVFGTNPLAFAMPGTEGPTLVIDQSCSATALVNIRRAAECGERLPPGWALDSNGRPTRDPLAALTGALRSFGGYKGDNVALMVEMLAAGMTGANWSCDAPSFCSGDQCPDSGLLIIALCPLLLTGEGVGSRTSDYLHRFAENYGGRVPGAARVDAAAQSGDGVAVAVELLERIRGYCR